jgi:hypothetical protein
MVMQVELHIQQATLQAEAEVQALQVTQTVEQLEEQVELD